MTQPSNEHQRNRLNTQQPKHGRLSRRDFLKGASAMTAAASVASMVSSCRVDFLSDETDVRPTPTPLPTSFQYPETPPPPDRPPEPGAFGFFSAQEARTVEALTATILPGSPDDPGAREAGVVTYIDALMQHDGGFAQPIYRSGPFAQTYEGESPPSEETDQAGRETIWVSQDEIDRYGYQSVLTFRDMYRAGIPAVNNYAMQEFGSEFADLSEDQQEQIVGDMEAGEATGFTDPSAEDFFELLRTHTIEGMFSDPAYGGNRDMVGWRLIGYPGAQRAYTPADMHAEGQTREPQSLAQLHHFKPGKPADEPNVVLPVSGSGTERESN